eukprot:CAMPEP_0117418698 /NCGR_PEP_ID=MMETSP0758-20121206/412_1 /TAXON_ID=63605 /ORGANISM="Percolomonas cosmopolitus, Strain AE-1 (ATCC 50343)" /LENGTH=427 /DNA_ID=CAMNT_0005199327 /DNA_START=138 /DNA_END=1419 /DNA_ORIENTATION=+
MREYIDCVQGCSKTSRIKRHFTEKEYSALYDNEEVLADAEKENYGLLDQQKIWEKYRHELVQALTRGKKGPSYIQVLSIPEDAAWDENPAQFKEICDREPYWDQFYSTSPYKISTEYKNFIENVKAGNNVVDQGSKKELDKYVAQHASLEGNLRNAKRDCYKQFATANTNLPLDQYMKTKCTSYKNTLNQMQDIATYIEFYTILAYGEANANLQKVRNEVKGGMDYHEAGTSLSEFKKLAQKGQGTSLKFNMNHFTSSDSSQTYASYAKGLKRPSSLNGGFFSQLTASGKGISTKSEQFKMSIDFKAYKRINIAPNDWFRLDVLRKYKNGPFTNAQPNLFGNGGRLRLLPTAIYVAYQPKFTLIVNKKDAFNFKNSKRLGKSGFFSSKKTTYSVNSQFKSSDEYIVTMSTTSTTPQVIAMDFMPIPW